MKRRGFTLFEVFVALMLLGTLTALCLEFFAGVTGQQKDQNAALAATQEAANVMERLAAVPWDDLLEQKNMKFKLSSQAQKMLPEGRVDVGVEDSSESPPARRITVAVYWRPLPGQGERNSRVVAWRYKQP